MKFYFVRHGESEANARRCVADGFSPLTATGRHQSRQTGEQLNNAGITKILSSPYTRALQTAEEIAGVIGYDLNDIIVVDELKERSFGRLENGPEVHTTHWFFANDTGDGFESHAQVIERCKVALKIIERYITDDETVLVVGHATYAFFLEQVAKGRTKYREFDEPRQLKNAECIEISIHYTGE